MLKRGGLALRMQEREFEHRRSLATARDSANRRVEVAESKAAIAVRKGREMADRAANLAAEYPIVDTVVEFGGTLGEAFLFKKAPNAAKYVPFVGFAAEAVLLYELVRGAKGRSAGTRELVRGGATFARGLTQRWRVAQADKIMNAIFK